MGLFSREKKKPSQLESLIENTMYTILRDAKSEDPAHVLAIGKEKYIQDCIESLDRTSAQIPQPLKGVHYVVHRKKNHPLGDVSFYFRVSGDSSIFKHYSTMYRLNGVLGTDGKHLVYITYRESQFTNAQNLAELFNRDIQVLREFLFEVNGLLDVYRHQLRKELNFHFHNLEESPPPSSELIGELEQLGFKPMQE